MKRKYVDVKIDFLACTQDIMSVSNINDNPNIDDGYDLSGFAGGFQQE